MLVGRFPPRSRDRRLYILRSCVNVAAQIELKSDAGRPE